MSFKNIERTLSQNQKEMAEIKKQPTETRDFKERFEFRLTNAENNIICQRYFKIMGFNPKSLYSYELADTIRYCAQLIENELKLKNVVYTEAMAPRIFESEEQMNAYFEVPEHRAEMHLGEGIVIRPTKQNFVWGKNDTPVATSQSYDNTEFTQALTDDDYVTFKFAFLDSGREVVSTVWETAYPKYIRNSIDLTNKRGKFEGEDVSKLGFEAALLNRMVAGRPDLVNKIVREICVACSNLEALGIDDYTTEAVYKVNGKKQVYKNYTDKPKAADEK